MNQPEHVLTVQNRLGETPIWREDENALYWVDWGEGLICRWEPDGGAFKAFALDLPVTALARRASGGWVVIAHNGLFAWETGDSACRRMCASPDATRPELAFNDAAVDRQGRLLDGPLNSDDPFAPDGGLYRFDRDGTLTQLDGGYATANGIGVSPDGATVYVTDMRHQRIMALDYDPVYGSVIGRRVFAEVPADQGMPDGLIVDAEGCVWSGHWDGWRLTRYTPAGQIERQVHFPVQHVISFAFTGAVLDELLVTTAWYGFGEAERRQQPCAGDLFRLRMGIQGMLEPAFAG